MSFEPPEHRACRTPDLDEAAIRADERRRMDHALEWHTTCFGCADRMDALIAERHAGQEEAAQDIIARLEALYAQDGDRAHLVGVAVARRWLGEGAQRAAAASVSVPEGSGQGAPL